MKKVVCLIVLLLLGAVFAAAPAVAADASDLAGRAAAWEKEYNAGNLKGVLVLYASAGCRMPPNQETVHGSDAILAQLKSGLDHSFQVVDFCSDRTQESRSYFNVSSIFSSLLYSSYF